MALGQAAIYVNFTTFDFLMLIVNICTGIGMLSADLFD